MGGVRLFNRSLGKTFKLYSMIVLFALYFYLLGFEALVFCRRGSNYLEGLHNWSDLLIYTVFVPVFVSTVIINPPYYLDDKKQWYNFLLTLYIGFMGGRALLNMRVFDGMRYLIAMLVQVFKDLVYFITVFFIFVVIFAFIENELAKLQPDSPPNLFTFLSNLDNIY